MLYISTRGKSPKIDFTQACLRGLAPDGGLYVPETWPQITPPQPGEDYAGFAARLLSAFAGDSVPHTVLLEISRAAYGRFGHAAITPLSQIERNTFVLELYHGPTLAFKDVAMQILGGLYEYILDQSGQSASVVCATSGDTGGAAAYAFAGRRAINLFILHPDARVSPVQRRFMTTTGANNVHNFAIEGDFDICQAAVKSMFTDEIFRERVALTGVNSINWVRIAAQAVYYAMTQAALGPSRPLRFIVPTGNMGDAFAGYVAWKCGLLAHFDIHCAMNANDGMTALWETGKMNRPQALATNSPAMDISVPSNLERLIFELTGRNALSCREAYASFNQSNTLTLPDNAKSALDTLGISASGVSDAETMSEIKRLYTCTGRLFCPHTAIGTYAAHRNTENTLTRICLATADASKFPETVAAATGVTPTFLPHISNISNKVEVFEKMPPSEDLIRQNIIKSI